MYSLFQGIRQMFGCNDNPSAKQFESAWRKLLGQHQIGSPETANCMDNDFKSLTVLNASSRKQELGAGSSNDWPPPFIKDIHNNKSIENNNVVFEDDFGDFTMDEGDYLITDSSQGINIEDHVASYLAAVLEKCIIEGRWYAPIKCKDCFRVFAEDLSVDDDFVKLKMKTNKLSAPAQTTVDICKAAEISMREFNYATGRFNQIQESVLSKLDFNDLFWASDFNSHPEENHKMRLVKLIIEMYIKKKQDYISRCNTLAAHQVLWRSLLRKLVHFRGQ